MTAKGSRVDYTFPYNEAIPMEMIMQQMHIVVPTSMMTSNFRVLKDCRKDDLYSINKYTLLTYVAQALKNAKEHRGAHAKHWYVGETPRVQVLITYVTEQLFENKIKRIPMNSRALYDTKNVVAIMYSIFIFDEDLSFADAISDQFRINNEGAPFKRIKKGDADEVGPQQNPRQAPEPEVPAERVGRPDKPGMFLDANGSTWYHRPTEEHTRSIKTLYDPGVTADSVNNHKKIRTLKHLLMLIMTNSNNMINVRASDSNCHMSALGIDSPLQLQNAFTLQKALGQLEVLGANALFTRYENWVNSTRNGELSFGPPCWGSGELLHEKDGIGVRVYEAGHTQTTALYPLSRLSAFNLTNDCLPHCELFDAEELRPKTARQLTMMNGQNGAVCLDFAMESMGILSAQEAEKRKRESSLNQDMFNRYFKEMAPVEAEIRKKMITPVNPGAEYINELEKLRAQGLARYNTIALDVEHPELPDAFKASIFHQWKSIGQRPIIEDLWQTRNVAMTPFAQYKVLFLIVMETLIRTADSQLFIMPLVLRAAMSTYWPKVFTNLYKEHVQMTCAPGTSKSDLLNKMVDLLIEKTYELQGGSSPMGLLGAPRSQRLILIHHELPGVFAPTKDPDNPQAEQTHKMLLASLSEGHAIYHTTGDDEQGRKVEKVRHNEFTNTHIGAKNYTDRNYRDGGPAFAMTDRFHVVHVMPLLMDNRVSVVAQVLRQAQGTRSTANMRVTAQFQIKQLAIMNYCAQVAYYARPFPDLSLSADLVPKMVSWLACMQPSINNNMRSISLLNPRLATEVLMSAIDLAIFSPLNPTMKRIRLTDDERLCIEAENLKTGHLNKPIPTERVEVAEYNIDILEEVSKYAYLRMDVLIYVVTEKLFDMTGGEKYEIMRGVAERAGNYYVYGNGRAEKNLEAQENWPVENEIAGHLLPNRSCLKSFVDGYFFDNPVYYLGTPASHRQTAQQMRNTPGVVGYNSYELRPENVPIEFRTIFESAAVHNREIVRLNRSNKEEKPQYKRENVDGKKYINPNYIRIGGSITNFTRSSAGRFGKFNMSAGTLAELITSLVSHIVTTPYMPLISESSAYQHHLNLVQSLRYMPMEMRKLPMYKVPAVISDFAGDCFYILASYVETNPHQIARELVNHICYEGTRPQRCIMGIPCEKGGLLYEPIHVMPIPGKKLQFGTTVNMRAATTTILKKYLEEDAGMIKKSQSSRVYYETDIEHEHAKDFLFRNFPSESRATLVEKYTPSGIHNRMYGPNGYYTNNQEDLLDTMYPQVLADPITEPVPAPTVTEVALEAFPRKRPAIDLTVQSKRKYVGNQTSLDQREQVIREHQQVEESADFLNF